LAPWLEAAALEGVEAAAEADLVVAGEVWVAEAETDAEVADAAPEEAVGEPLNVTP
jgi:hypothetical protein